MRAAVRRKRDSRARVPRRRPTQTLVLLEYPDENELVGKPIAVVGPPRLIERRGVRAFAIAAGVVVAMGSIIGGLVALQLGGVSTSNLRSTAPDPLIVPKMPTTSPAQTYLASISAARQPGRISRPTPSPTVVSQMPATYQRPSPSPADLSRINLAHNQPVTASGYTQTYVPANAVDGNTGTYWESTDNAFPQWFQVDLGSAVSISRIVMDLPPLSVWGTRTETITIQGSTDGTTYTTLAASAGYTFTSPANTVTVTFPAASVRYLKLTFTANTGWPAGQLSELQVYAT